MKKKEYINKQTQNLKSHLRIAQPATGTSDLHFRRTQRNKIIKGYVVGLITGQVRLKNKLLCAVRC